MAKNKLAKGKITTSTQDYLDIAEVKDDLVIMKDGTIRAVVMVSSVNFALKSEDEQGAIIASYVGFLNNIDFPIQIIVQSRELNIDNYLNSLQQKEKEQTNDLLKLQIKDYIANIKELISMGKIMNKSFYIAIPYNPLSDSHKNFMKSIAESFRPATTIKMEEKMFERYKKEITRRIETVLSSLGSMGLNSAVLDTQGLIELFYNSYNPRTSQNQKMTDVKDLRIAE